MKRETELAHLNKVFDFDNSYLRCFGINKSKCSKILSNLSDFANRCSCSGPDLYCKIDNSIIGIEHFTYDASNQSKNGSKERRAIDRVNKVFQEESRLSFQNGRKELQKTYNLNADGNVKTLKANFLSGYNKHIKKINSYTNNLTEKLNVKKPDIWLIAEDVSLMGPVFHSNYLVDDYSEIPLLPVFYEDIQGKIAKSPIQGIIFASTFPISNCIIFIRNEAKSFRKLQKYYHFSDNVAIQFFNNSSYTCSSFLIAEIKE